MATVALPDGVLRTALLQRYVAAGTPLDSRVIEWLLGFATGNAAEAVWAHRLMHAICQAGSVEIGR